MKKRNRFIAMAVLCSFGTILSGCQKEEAETMSQAIKVEIQTAKEGTLTLTSNYVGSVTPKESVTVTPMVAGEVDEVYVKIGDKVKKGDILCHFDDTTAQFSVDNAKIAAKSARAGKKAASSQQELASVQTDSSISTLQTQLEGYQSSLKDAKEQLKTLEDSQDTLKKASEATKTAYDTQKSRYKAAQKLYLNYQVFLQSNVDCQTSAGLTIAMTEMGPEGNLTPKADTATKLMKELGENGLTVEYLNQTGINTLKEDVDDAKTAYDSASAMYTQSQTGITTLETSITTLEAQIKATKEGIRTAKSTKGISSQAAKDSAASVDAQIDAADIGVDMAEYQADMYTIKAPIDGVVDSVNVKKNEMFANAPAFVISGTEAVKVTYYVTEEVSNFAMVGDEVTVESNGETYEGNISQIATAADAQKKLFKMEAQVYLEKGEKIGSGTSVKVSMNTSETSGAILIPYDSVYYDDNQAYIFCVTDGKAVRTDVETGLYNDSTIEITDGIEAGDKVITSWSSGLKNGTKVETVQKKK